jgi:hypothetical protein
MSEKSKDEARLERKRRLSRALKANLSRRKAQRRGPRQKTQRGAAGPESKTGA